jgi:hypothetical protein
LTDLSSAQRGDLTVSQFRSLLGMLEHLRALWKGPRAWMFFLWAAVSDLLHPEAKVRVSESQRKRLVAWANRLVCTKGLRLLALVVLSSPSRDPSSKIVLFMSADAAKAHSARDRRGLGAFCHGLFVHVPLPSALLQGLAIGLLELLASLLALLTFAEQALATGAAVLDTDSITSDFILTEEAARTQQGQAILDAFLQLPIAAKLVKIVSARHCFGPGNPFGDLVSRNKRVKLSDMATQMQITLRELRPPRDFARILHTIAVTLPCPADWLRALQRYYEHGVWNEELLVWLDGERVHPHPGMMSAGSSSAANGSSSGAGDFACECPFGCYRQVARVIDVRSFCADCAPPGLACTHFCQCQDECGGDSCGNIRRGELCACHDCSEQAVYHRNGVRSCLQCASPGPHCPHACQCHADCEGDHCGDAGLTSSGALPGRREQNRRMDKIVAAARWLPLAMDDAPTEPDGAVSPFPLWLALDANALQQRADTHDLLVTMSNILKYLSRKHVYITESDMLTYFELSAEPDYADYVERAAYGGSNAQAYADYERGHTDWRLTLRSHGVNVWPAWLVGLSLEQIQARVVRTRARQQSLNRNDPERSRLHEELTDAERCISDIERMSAERVSEEPLLTGHTDSLELEGRAELIAERCIPGLKVGAPASVVSAALTTLLWNDDTHDLSYFTQRFGADEEDVLVCMRSVLPYVQLLTRTELFAGPTRFNDPSNVNGVWNVDLLQQLDGERIHPHPGMSYIPELDWSRASASTSQAPQRGAASVTNTAASAPSHDWDIPELGHARRDAACAAPSSSARPPSVPRSLPSSPLSPQKASGKHPVYQHLRDKHKLTHRAKLTHDSSEGALHMPDGFAWLDNALEEAELAAANPTTLKKDEGIWTRYWRPITQLFGTSELRDFPNAVNGSDPVAHTREVRLLCYALILVGCMMKPRSKQDRAAKVSSWFQVLLSVRRMHLRLQIAMVPLKFVREVLKGLVQIFIQTHGAEALLPKRKAPIPFSVFIKLTAVETVRIGSRVWNANSTLGVSTLAMICLLWSTGFRKAEIVDNARGTHLRRSSLKWCIAGRLVESPSIAQLQSLKEGCDYVEVWPRQSKCDATGEVWGDKKIFLAYYNTPGNACAALARLEMEVPVEAKDRECTPLFIDDDGSAVTASLAVLILHSMLCSIGESSYFYTWHSFRISLATRLGRIDCPDSKIQILCRWQSAESLLIYRRFGFEEYNKWLSRAFDVSFDTGSLPRTQVDSAAALAAVAGLEEEEAPNTAQPVHTEPVRARTTRPQASPMRGVPPRPQRKRKATEPSDLSPITGDNAVGRTVLVPILPGWEKYECSEHDGLGWTARVLSATSRTAIVDFLFAVTATGRRYKPMRVPLDSLRPL